jgi:hypothetical protein
MKRRYALTLLLGLLATPAFASQAREWRFTAYLDDTEIGYHRFVLVENGPESELVSEARFNVKFLFFNAYRYAHDNREQWRGDCLAQIESTTDDNGKPYRVRGAPEGDAFILRTATEQTPLPSCPMTFAYWNPAFLKQSRLLNSQTGEYLPVSVQALGADTIRVRGENRKAQHYRLQARDFDIELWYSPAGEWLALDSLTVSGKRLRYRQL